MGKKDTIKDADNKLKELEKIMQHLGSLMKLARPVAQEGEFHKFLF